jgi:alcohol dehydrogenase class IV
MSPEKKPEHTDQFMSIPRWFVRFLTTTASLVLLILTIAVPWAIRVDTNMQILTHEIQAFTELESSLHRHLQDPSIHVAAIDMLKLQIIKIQADMAKDDVREELQLQEIAQLKEQVKALQNSP